MNNKKDIVFVFIGMFQNEINQVEVCKTEDLAKKFWNKYTEKDWDTFSNLESYEEKVDYIGSNLFGSTIYTSEIKA